MTTSKDSLARRRELILPLLQDKNPSVQKCASRALEKVESQLDLDTWISHQKEGKNREMRVKAVYALSRIPGEKAFRAIVEATKSPEEDVRAAAVRALRQRNEMQTFEILVELLEDQSIVVRALAAETIGLKGARKLVPYLLAHLSENNKEVLEQVLTALGKLGDPLAEKPLIEMLNHPEPWVRGLAALALGDLEPPGD
jgi:HEAT repeat protein